MRAWVFHKAGPPSEVLKLDTNWPKPEPSGTKILVEVHAVSLNPVGWKSMSTPPISWGQKKPCVPEADVSGVVAGGELEGTGLSMGDEVFGIVPYDTVMKSGKGVLAEYTLVESKLLAKKPSNLSHAEAASFPLAGLTAWQALVIQGGLKEGDGKKVFINGGSGGVGAYAVQIAKAFGAHVVTTSSPSSDSLVSTLGADEMIDYHSVDLPKYLAEKHGAAKFDLVFDTVGVKSVWDGCEGFLKPEGQYVDVAGPHMDSLLSALAGGADLACRLFRPKWLGGVKRRYTFMFLQATQRSAELQEAASLLAKGTIKPIVDQVFAFDDAHKAYERSMSGRAKGKVVVKVE